MPVAFVPTVGVLHSSSSASTLRGNEAGSAPVRTYSHRPQHRRVVDETGLLWAVRRRCLWRALCWLGICAIRCGSRKQGGRAYPPWLAEPALGSPSVGALEHHLGTDSRASASRGMEAAAAPVDIDVQAAAGPMHHIALVGAAGVNEWQRQRTAELLSAAEFGNVPALERCLATECSPDLHDDAGRTALWLACWEGH